jgi:hypothetical protein
MTSGYVFNISGVHYAIGEFSMLLEGSNNATTFKNVSKGVTF